MESNAKREIDITMIPTLAIIKKMDELPGWKVAAIRGGDKRRTSVKKKRPGNDFKHWNLPEEPHGYIKARENDFL